VASKKDLGLIAIGLRPLRRSAYLLPQPARRTAPRPNSEVIADLVNLRVVEF